METETEYNAPKTLATGPLSAVPIGNQGIVLQSFSDAARFAEMIWRARMAPKDIDTPEKVLVVMQMGMEVGLPPMAALNGIAVINGRPSIWGDNLPGLVTGKGAMEDMEEWYELNGVRLERAPSKPSSGLSAVCLVKRRGRDRALIREFTWDMAVQARLHQKSGPWTDYPLRMLQMRARAWAIRDQFPDVLRGCAVAEELLDITPPAAEKPVESLLPPTPPATEPAAENAVAALPEPKSAQPGDERVKTTPYEKSLARKAAREAAKTKPTPAPTVEAEVIPEHVPEQQSAPPTSGPAEKFPPPPARGAIPTQAAHQGGDVVPFALDPSPVDRKPADDEPFI